MDLLPQPEKTYVSPNSSGGPLTQTSLQDQIEQRLQSLQQQQRVLLEQHRTLSHNNQLHAKITDFATRVAAALDTAELQLRQDLLRLVMEEVAVTGWNGQIRLRIPLDQSPNNDNPKPSRGTRRKPSSEEHLRALRNYGLRDGHIRCLAQAEQAG